MHNRFRLCFPPGRLRNPPGQLANPRRIPIPAPAAEIAKQLASPRDPQLRRRATISPAPRGVPRRRRLSKFHATRAPPSASEISNLKSQIFRSRSAASRAMSSFRSRAPGEKKHPGGSLSFGSPPGSWRGFEISNLKFQISNLRFQVLVFEIAIFLHSPSIFPPSHSQSRVDASIFLHLPAGLEPA